MFLSPFLFSIVLEVLANTIGQGKELKDTQIGKEDIQFSFIEDDIIIICVLIISKRIKNNKKALFE